jgi:hypothetical protein
VRPATEAGLTRSTEAAKAYMRQLTASRVAASPALRVMRGQSSMEWPLSVFLLRVLQSSAVILTLTLSGTKGKRKDPCICLTCHEGIFS